MESLEMSNALITFVCPACQEPLLRISAELICTVCAARYDVVDNIPVFLSSQPYYGEIERERMHALLDEAERQGYKEAIRQFIRDDFVYAYVVDEQRAKWTELLNLERHSKVLDVGCGWGTVSIPMSRLVEQTVSIDATFERVKFVKIRASQMGAHNVIPAVASAIGLPFAAEQFDVVTFNGVLEWLGASDFSLDPKECQMLALQQAFRVLKTGGKVYVGIENRYSLRYFLGDPDDHSFIRFTSLMPRRLASWYCKMRTGTPYYTYTHSLKVYSAMLEDAGFSDVQAYYPWPTYRNPDEIVPLNWKDVSALLGRRRRSAESLRQSMYLSLLKCMTALERKGRACHSFCFVATK